MAFDINVIKEVYRQMPGRIEKARQLVGRPLTLSEKILYSHLWDDNSSKAFERGKDYVDSQWSQRRWKISDQKSKTLGHCRTIQSACLSGQSAVGK